ncbi:RHS repeat domain-containing protein [Shewanella colwelliana]|uniref:RHS repeat domain-containing protein n=1 Tax=Shewanella colwelliana TaxID=23 RepID=UPI0022AF88FD|nr:hypothetical protein [Shewanella colwelliana]MCZ4339894.1 hypothetical protein [Shewanella colwelliana]
MSLNNAILVLILGFFCGQQLHADTYIKLISDRPQSDVYVNSEVVGTFYDTPLEFILPPGEYLIEVKKENDDGSYGYFKRTLKVGRIDTKLSIMAELKKEYPHDYYLKQATTLQGAQIYLDKFPEGQYHEKVSDFLELEYAKQVTSVESAKVYFERYPQGRYNSAIMNKDIYLVVAEKKVLNGETYITRYHYDQSGVLLETASKESEDGWFKIFYTYNDQGQRKKVLREEKGQITQKQTYTYNSKGLLVEERNESKGKETKIETYSYDDKGRLEEERHYWESSYTDYVRNIMYSYDSRGNLIEKLNRSVLSGKSRDFLSYKTTYVYNKKNILVEEYEEHLKDGSWSQVNYTYDETGFLQKKRRQESGRREFDKTYDYEKPIVEYSRDELGKILEEVVNPSSRYPVRIIYGYNESGILTEKNKHFTDGRHIRYTYDASGNLIEEHYFPDSDGDTHTKNWEYKAFKLKNLLL